METDRYMRVDLFRAGLSDLPTEVSVKPSQRLVFNSFQHHLTADWRVRRRASQRSLAALPITLSFVTRNGIVRYRIDIFVVVNVNGKHRCNKG